MFFYTEAKDGAPKNRIDYCFKCRLIELYQEKSRKFQEIEQHHHIFQEYLSATSTVPEAKIRNILKNAKIDFKLRTPTFLVHQYNGETFARDIINGFASKRYDTNTLFSVIEEGVEAYKHCLSGYHMRGEIELPYAGDFSYFACKLIDKGGEIDIRKYGDDLMDCALTSMWAHAGVLRCRLLGMCIKYSRDIVCKIAATNAGLFKVIMSSYQQVFDKDYDLVKRNKNLTINPSRVHPKHVRFGLNLIDILVLLNPDPNPQISEYTDMLSEEDLKILTKSLKHWLKNVRNEADFELMRRHIKCFQGDYIIEEFLHMID